MGYYIELQGQYHWNEGVEPEGFKEDRYMRTYQIGLGRIREISKVKAAAAEVDAYLQSWRGISAWDQLADPNPGPIVQSVLDTLAPGEYEKYCAAPRDSNGMPDLDQMPDEVRDKEGPFA